MVGNVNGQLRTFWLDCLNLSCFINCWGIILFYNFFSVRLKWFSSQKRESVLLLSFVRLLKTTRLMPLLPSLHGKKKNLLFGGICMWPIYSFLFLFLCAGRGPFPRVWILECLSTFCLFSFCSHLVQYVKHIKINLNGMKQSL